MDIFQEDLAAGFGCFRGHTFEIPAQEKDEMSDDPHHPAGQGDNAAKFFVPFHIALSLSQNGFVKASFFIKALQMRSVGTG
jgi:hypothetical protein